MTDDSISRAAVEAAFERRVGEWRGMLEALNEPTRPFVTNEEFQATAAIEALLEAISDIRSIPPAPEGERLREALDDALTELELSKIASCHCLTKTPEAKYHEDHCRYKRLCLVCDNLRAALTQTKETT